MPEKKRRSPKASQGASTPEEATEPKRRIQPQYIAKRLHEGICQSVTGARMMASVARRKLPANSDEASAMLQTLDVHLKNASEELRALIRELRES